MKIAILTHGTLPFGRQYAQLFARRGHTVVFYSLSPCQGLPGIDTHCFSAIHPSQTSARWHYICLIPRLREAIRRDRPDALLAMYLTSAGLVGSLAGSSRLVVSALGTDVNGSVGRFALRQLLRWVCRSADRVHAVSEPLAESLAHWANIQKHKILVAPIGVNTQSLVIPPHGTRPRSGRILCTRNAGPVYDHPTLLKAIHILKDRDIPCGCTFTLRNYAEVERQANALGLGGRVSFLGGYESEALPHLMASHDVYVSCSLSDGTSQSLLEAMSTGTFPIVSDIPANRPWVEHGDTGMLFPPSNPVALADCLQEAFSRPDWLESKAWALRAVVIERGDALREADRLLQLLAAD